MGFMEWFKKTTFSGTIVEQCGEVEDYLHPSGSIMSLVLRVQAFRKRGQPYLPLVRLNLISKSALGFSSQQIVISTDTARDLVRHLEAAIHVSENTNA